MDVKIKREPDSIKEESKYVYYAYDSNKYLESEISEKEALAKLYVEVTPECQKLIDIEIGNIKLIELAENTISNFKR